MKKMKGIVNSGRLYDIGESTYIRGLLIHRSGSFGSFIFRELVINNLLTRLIWFHLVLFVFRQKLLNSKLGQIF